MPEINNYPDYIVMGVCRSHFKMNCEGCGGVINRGDEITQCKEISGMTLRVREIAPRPYSGFYTPFTGARWVHKECRINSFWTDYLALMYTNEYYS